MITGSIVALVTPMKDTGEIDKQEFIKLVEMHVANGTNAIVINGTTGESATLDWDESLELVKLALNIVRGRVPIIVGTGTNSTKVTIQRTKEVDKLGIDAVLVVAPYYNKPTQKGLYLHYKAISDETQAKIIVYNVPGRTVSDIHCDTVIKLAELKNIIGLKDASGELSRLTKLKKECPAGFKLYSGDDPTALEYMLQGGDGVISISANIAPKLMSSLCKYAVGSKNVATAKAINLKLAELHEMLVVESNPIPVKWAMHYLKLISVGIRLPLTNLTVENQQRMKRVLAVAGI